MHSDWAILYQDLLGELGRILADPAAGDGQIREHLHSLLTEHRTRRPASRAELIRTGSAQRGEWAARSVITGEPFWVHQGEGSRDHRQFQVRRHHPARRLSRIDLDPRRRAGRRAAHRRQGQQNRRGGRRPVTAVNHDVQPYTNSSVVIIHGQLEECAHRAGLIQRGIVIGPAVGCRVEWCDGFEGRGLISFPELPTATLKEEVSMNEDFARRLAALEDVEQIRGLRDLYHQFVNERQSERFKEIYAADGSTRLDAALHWRGIDEIVEGFRDLFVRVSFLTQFGHNHRITLAGDEASAISYLDARYAAGSESLMVAARYDETYVRTAAGWRIRDTICTVLFAVSPTVGWAGGNLNKFGGGKP
jgi:hypothetical protein